MLFPECMCFNKKLNKFRRTKPSCNSNYELKTRQTVETINFRLYFIKISIIIRYNSSSDEVIILSDDDF